MPQNPSIYSEPFGPLTVSFCYDENHKLIVLTADNQTTDITDNQTTNTTDNQTHDTPTADRAMDTMTTDQTKDTPTTDRAMDTMTTDTKDNKTPDTLENYGAMDTLTTEHTRDTPITYPSMDTQTLDATENHCNQSCKTRQRSQMLNQRSCHHYNRTAIYLCHSFQIYRRLGNYQTLTITYRNPKVGKTRQKING